MHGITSAALKAERAGRRCLLLRHTLKMEVMEVAAPLVLI